MAALDDIYAFLEKKNDAKPIDSVFPWDSFSSDEQQLARLEILSWWNLEKVVEDDNCPIDTTKAISYFKKRIENTNNYFLRYRYCYFAYLLTKNNCFAKNAVDALILCINNLLPENKEEYPNQAVKAIGIVMMLSKSIKYKQEDVRNLLWDVLDSGYGYKTKLSFLEEAIKQKFLLAKEAERASKKCKELLTSVGKRWDEKCCEIGLFYAKKIQNGGGDYKSFFNEALGDIEIAKLMDISADPNNIFPPHYNNDRLEKAMYYYKEAGAMEKMEKAENQFVSNKKNLKYLTFTSSIETNKEVVVYFNKLKEKLLGGKFNLLMGNLVSPIRFLFPNMQIVDSLLKTQKPPTFSLDFTNKMKDINGNTLSNSFNIQTFYYYDIWLMNVVQNYVINVILTAVQKKIITYSKLKSWFLRSTCFGIPIDYSRPNEISSSSWFLQIDYAIKALIIQYQRFSNNLSADWRIPIDTLSIRFEGFIRDIVSELGGQVTKIDRNGNTTEALLDDLLQESCLLQVFDNDDIYFFKFIFTSKGLNIRNNVAHSFYIPQDYEIYKATLVFLCILRLAKFDPYKKQRAK
ncbi:MAG: DUF4209 domain-containing protein [Bacteroidales bacterium]|nr:DUF4209 domain-containing protein [Bacteroidales bacterium]